MRKHHLSHFQHLLRRPLARGKYLLPLELKHAHMKKTIQMEQAP